MAAKKVSKKEEVKVEENTVRVLNFELERETPNTRRYKEVTEGGQPPLMRTLYLANWFNEEASKVRVTIELLG